MIASIAEGHVDLADVLFLVAFIVCVVDVIIRLVATPRVYNGLAMTVGLALISLAFFVL